MDNDVKFNAKKSHAMFVTCKDHNRLVFPDFYLCGTKLEVCKETRYLGHFFTEDLCDDRDIYRQCRKLYAQGNTLCRKFHMCSHGVKIALFRAYCTPLYTAHLWCRYKKGSLRKLIVAYNDAMRMLLQLPRHSSASRMFADAHVPSCQAVVRNLTFKFIERIDISENDIVNILVNPMKSCTRYTSELWKRWYDNLLAES